MKPDAWTPKHEMNWFTAALSQTLNVTVKTGRQHVEQHRPEGSDQRELDWIPHNTVKSNIRRFIISCVSAARPPEDLSAERLRG